MKHRILAILMVATLFAPVLSAAERTSKSDWYNNKFSMFIHFGLYSQLGGVWNGKEIHTGYSEQIQSHAGIYGDVYSDVARSFNPVNFDADSIVTLAKNAGMRSIVMTSKHHDGFCLFRTETTDYNAYDATPAHRDFVAELSEACHKGGIGFGLYFSIIDWNEPYGAPITSHNADFATPEHHRFNMAQVKELVTNYGSVSELWFDMGSLTPEQSKDLYDLVKEYQPDCMVSGRLGNGQYDFAVMSDNYYPEASLQTPWQSCASMFNETWGYRSWQKRGSAEVKAREKLASLIRVAAAGGNFLLNIGPKGDGSVVPFEREVLNQMGAWLQANGDVIYGTEGSPFMVPFWWGGITRKGNAMNLILSGDVPENGVISVPMKGYKLVKANGPASVSLKNGVLTVIPYDDAYEGDIKVVRLTFNKEVVPANDVTEANGLVPSTSYFCQDYYTNARSITGYHMDLPAGTDKLELSYVKSDFGKTVKIDVDGKSYDVVLGEGDYDELDVTSDLLEKDRCIATYPVSTFDGAIRSSFKWTPVEMNGEVNTLESEPFQTSFIKETIVSPVDQEILMDVGAGNGVELYVNGVSVMKHLNPYRCTFNFETVRVPLRAGENEIILRAYNRFEKENNWLLRIAEAQFIYKTSVKVGPLASGSKPTLSLTQAGLSSPHQDCELHNLRIR